jgi:phytoene synthase
MAKGSGSFHLATRMFGRSLREDVWQLYAWCRYCDDEIDGQDHGRGAEALSSEERAARLARLRRETKAALAGKEVSEPAFKAFQHVALEHRLAETWPLEMLDGFAMDVDHATYPTVESTLRYCWGVAGVVGVMMASIMGVADEAVLRRAQDLGLACQLTNICRDIAEDAANGRVYLPADVLEKAGLNAEPSDITAAVGTTALFAAASEMLDLADRYYASARAGIRFLPFRAAVAIAVARDIYREIGRRIMRKGPAALAQRATVPTPVMLGLVVRGLFVALWSRLEPRRLPPRPPLWSRV